MVGLWIFVMAAILISQRLLELYIAKNHYAWMMSGGAQEFGREHYRLFFILHTSWFIGWIAEGSSLGHLHKLWYVWLGLFAAAQILRYWCIASLGQYWNTRILVIPGRQRISKGPYRFIKHPNYLAVAIELVAVPLIFNAWVTAVIAALLNAVLLLGIRIPAEEKALRAYLGNKNSS